jgi:hypothetical protein
VSFYLQANRFRKVVPIAVVESNISAFPGKDFTDRSANPTRSSRNERTFSLKQQAHQLSVS